MRVLLIISCLSLFNTFGQDSSKVDAKNVRFIGLPVVFYAPETNWGFGALLSNSFKIKPELDSLTRLSSIKFLGAYTLNKQYIFHLPFEVYSSSNRFLFFGEIGHYLYSYNFYGIGNNVAEFEENYAVNFQRIKLNGLKRYNKIESSKKMNFLGIRYEFENFDLKNVDSLGRFYNSYVEGEIDNRTSAIGVIHRRDSRDNINFPVEGINEEISLQYDHPYWGSKYKFVEISYEISAYFKFPWNDVLAINGFTRWTIGTVPFNQLSMIGGSKFLRGYYRGRYRDNNLLLTQIAYRKHLFWRVGVEAFGGVGSVFNESSFTDIQYVRFAGGAGLRIQLDKKNKLNLRLDYGWGKNSSGFYFTIGEAF